MSIGTLLTYPPTEGKTFEEQLKDIERRYQRYELAMQDLSASHARLKDARLKAKKAKDRSKAEKIEKLRRCSSLLKECSLTVSGEGLAGLSGKPSSSTSAIWRSIRR